MVFMFKQIAKQIYYRLKYYNFFHYWKSYDIKYNNRTRGKEAAMTTLLILTHVLEKGLTMPNRRLGFAQPRVRELVRNCKECIALYGSADIEIQEAIKDLIEYRNIHFEANYKLPNDIIEDIEALSINVKSFTPPNNLELNKNDVFKKCTSFCELAYSRRTVRHFTNSTVENELLMKSVELAQTAPSACNRQSTRVTIIESKDKIDSVVRLQNGNRGFGHLANKYLLISSEQGAWDIRQKRSAYIDAGIFCMNLLYALYDNGIAACTLNAHLEPHEIRELRDVLSIPQSEVPIVFIAVGYPSEKMMIAKSQRKDVKDICRIV